MDVTELLPLFFMVCCIGFVLTFRYYRYSLIMPLLFELSLGSGLILYVWWGAAYPSLFFYVSLFVLGVAGVFVLFFGTYALIAFMLINARIVSKKESKSLSNSLSLILGVLLIAYIAAGALVDHFNNYPVLRLIWDFFAIAEAGITFVVLLFLLGTLLCNIFKPRKPADMIVVLGAGLIQGKVSPLLKSRINRALAYASRQQDLGFDAPYLIMSGGQGVDEPCSEASAMCTYAKEQGYPSEKLIAEEKSTTTAENMRYSKAICEEISQGKPYYALFSTSNYHILRAGAYARKERFEALGLGAKTAAYFLPNALMREFVAWVVMMLKAPGNWTKQTRKMHD